MPQQGREYREKIKAMFATVTQTRGILLTIEFTLTCADRIRNVGHPGKVYFSMSFTILWVSTHAYSSGNQQLWHDRSFNGYGQWTGSSVILPAPEQIIMHDGHHLDATIIISVTLSTGTPFQPKPRGRMMLFFQPKEAVNLLRLTFD